MKILKFFGFDRRNRSPIQENKANPPSKKEEVPISPGRVSEPDDDPGNFIHTLKGLTQMVTPSFRVEVIQLLRDLYKVNPDVNIALQDMFKLANTGHNITFPNNTDKEVSARLKVSRRTLQDYRNEGRIAYIQLGGKILYRESDIERMLNDGYRSAYRQTAV
jgi:uncharacterized protein YihD (DUF1040 family)